MSQHSRTVAIATFLFAKTPDQQSQPDRKASRTLAVQRTCRQGNKRIGLLIGAIATGALAVAFCSINAQAQTGPAVASGACSIANSGGAENLTINCGIGKEQGQKIIDLLNHALASKDVATVNAKLDELLQIAKQQSRLQPNHLYSDGTDYGSAQSQNGPDMKAKTILLSGFGALPGYEGKTLLYNYNDTTILKIVCPPVSTAPISGAEGHFGMFTLYANGLTCRVVR